MAKPGGERAWRGGGRTGRSVRALAPIPVLLVLAALPALASGAEPAGSAPAGVAEWVRETFAELRARETSCREALVPPGATTVLCARYKADSPTFRRHWDDVLARSRATRDIEDLASAPQTTGWVWRGGGYCRRYLVEETPLSVTFHEEQRTIVAVVEDSPRPYSSSERMRMGGSDGMTDARLVHQVLTEYPEQARKARAEGRVTLGLVIRVDGTVDELAVLRCTTLDQGFEEEALRAVRQWRYEPATWNGEPVAVYSSVVVDFSL